MGLLPICGPLLAVIERNIDPDEHQIWRCLGLGFRVAREGRTRNPGSSRRHVPSSSTALRSCRAARSSPLLACQGTAHGCLGTTLP